MLLRCLLFLFIWALSGAVGAQPVTERCATQAVLERALADDPALAARLALREAALERWLAENQNGQRGLVTVPVVVHLVYNTTGISPVSDHQVKSQIDALNEDFRRLNADARKTPADFAQVAADAEIEFCLARRDPSGNLTNGINRVHSTEFEWEETAFNTTHTVNAWDTERYLNIWVTRFTNDFILGYALPGGVGVVCANDVFGRIGNLRPKYNLGRTATHEIGHWLSLIHVWGPSAGCDQDDKCDDTPTQEDYHQGCPTHPKESCNNDGDMFMNYMDYPHDSCMNLFTVCQRQRMTASLNSQHPGIMTSNGCSPAHMALHDVAVTDILFPYLTVNTRYISPVIRVRNAGQNPVTSFELRYGIHKHDVLQYQWTGFLPANADTLLVLPQLRDSLGYQFLYVYAFNLNNGATESDTANNFMSRSFYVSPDAMDAQNVMRVLGNPGSGTFALEFDVLIDRGFSIDVFNALGQRVPYRVTNPLLNRLEVTIRDAVPGFYFVRVVNDLKRHGAVIVVWP